jgi:MFS family permease
MSSRHHKEGEARELLTLDCGYLEEPLDESGEKIEGRSSESQGGKIGNPSQATWRNLPQKKQLLLIALCRLSAPLTNTCLIPYLYFLVKSTIAIPDHGDSPQRIARTTGLLVAAFPLGQMITSILWGHVSDRYGRRPAILLGLAISVIANVGFAFSRSITMLLCWRVVAGAANGTEGVMRTITAEVVKDREHQPRAFLAPPVIFNSGRVIALAVGGCLTDPVVRLPYLVGSMGLFEFSGRPEGVQWLLDYPYALPALFNAVILTSCLAAATLWLRESLPNRKHRPCPGVASFGNLIKIKILRRPLHKYAMLKDELGDTTKCQGADVPTIWTQQACRALVTFTLLPLHNATFLHIIPVLLSMPVVRQQTPSAVHFHGGLGLDSPTIGVSLALFGIAGIILQLFIYPRMHSRIGTLGIFRIASAMFPMAYIVAPYLALLVDHSFTKWAAMVGVLFTQVMARTMAIPSSVLLLTEAAPHRKVLGTVHGAGNTVSALASACGPAVGGLLLAKGIQMGAIGLAWWSWLLVVSLIALVWSLILGEPSVVKPETTSDV